MYTIQALWTAAHDGIAVCVVIINNASYRILKQRTDAPFKELKGSIDSALAARYGISIADMPPWHYADPFFQEAPAVNQVSLDSYIKKKEIAELATKFIHQLDLTWPTARPRRRG